MLFAMYSMVAGYMQHELQSCLSVASDTQTWDSAASDFCTNTIMLHRFSLLYYTGSGWCYSKHAWCFIWLSPTTPSASQAPSLHLNATQWLKQLSSLRNDDPSPAITSTWLLTSRTDCLTCETYISIIRTISQFFLKEHSKWTGCED